MSTKFDEWWKINQSNFTGKPTAKDCARYAFIKGFMAVPIPTTKWFNTLPKEEGFFWFYGKRVDSDKDMEWFCVKNMKCANGFIAIIEGSFLFDWPDRVGLFCRAPLPRVPSEVVDDD